MRCTFNKAAFLPAILLSILLCACSVGKLADMSMVDSGSYAAIVWDGRTYVPYCAVSRGDCGRQIGIVDGDKNDKVYEYQGYPADEWIVSVYTTHVMDAAMLCREMNVAQIPDGLESEYAWNGELTVD